MHDALLTAYGPQHWWPAKTVFEVVLGAYLTQNTAWTQVERSLANLREAKALSVAGIRRLSETELQELVRPSGFTTRKAQAIMAFVALLDSEFGGSLANMAAAPATELRARLLQLPGVGQETADAILLYALGHAVPVADEYLRRVAERHALLPSPIARNGRGYTALAELTRAAFADDAEAEHAALYGEFHALVVAVGKAHCGKTADCADCPLRSDLPQKNKRPLRTREEHAKTVNKSNKKFRT